MRLGAPPRRQDLWQPEVFQRMIDHIEGGLTMSETARKLNSEFGTCYSKNAVAGKWDRFCREMGFR